MNGKTFLHSNLSESGQIITLSYSLVWWNHETKKGYKKERKEHIFNSYRVRVRTKERKRDRLFSQPSINNLYIHSSDNGSAVP